MQRRSAVVAAIIAGLVSALVAVTPASAETRIAVSPALLDLAGPLGGVGTVEIGVSNGGDEPLTLDASVIELETAEGLRSAASWAQVTPVELVVEPGERGIVTLALDIPADIVPGGHYAAVSIDATTAAADPQQTSGVSGRIVVPVMIAVTDGQEPTPRGKPAIDRSALFLYTDGGYRARAEVSNDGDTHIALQGSVALEAIDASGEREPAARLEVPIGRVLPQQVRVFPAADKASLTPGQPYEATYELFRPAHGRTADEEPELTLTTAFVAIPELRLEDLDICRTATGELQPSISLVNSGTIGVAPAVSFRAEADDGEIASLSRPIPEFLAWPMETTAASSLMLAPFEDGRYTLVAEVAVGQNDVLGVERTIVTGDAGTVPRCEATAGAE